MQDQQGLDAPTQYIHIYRAFSVWTQALCLKPFFISWSLNGGDFHRNIGVFQKISGIKVEETKVVGFSWIFNLCFCFTNTLQYTVLYLHFCKNKSKSWKSRKNHCLCLFHFYFWNHLKYSNIPMKITTIQASGDEKGFWDTKLESRHWRPYIKGFRTVGGYPEL